jgi:hypothetical protein
MEAKVREAEDQMAGRLHHVPLDDPYLGRFEDAHAIDHDPQSTTMAVGMVRDAVAAGHPADGTAAARVLTGASGATAVQATMGPFVDEATEHDREAEQLGTDAAQEALEAREAAERRRDLPNEPVRLSDGSSRTRGQVHRGHDDRVMAAAQREARGDFEHNARPLSLPVRMLVITVLALIEVFLLIWPVTDASWADPKSVAYVIGLVVLFILMNEQLPRLAGLAIREAREATHAAWELTHVGLSAGRAGDPDAGRETTGHVDERFVRAAERKKRIRCAMLGAVMAIYSAVMFTRVERLAAALGWPLGFVLLAAALITAFTAGGMLVLTWWWSRGNALGDQLREYGAVTDESRTIAEDLAAQSRDHARLSGEAADQAHRQLDLGEQAIHHGYHTVGVGLQKAAKILDQESVLMPRPENLFVIGRPIRDRAIGKIRQAAAIAAEAQQILASTPPFDPAAPHPNPWETRSAPRRAPANPAFVDPHQLGALHTPQTAPAPVWRKPWAWAAFGASLLTLTALTAITLLIHG